MSNLIKFSEYIPIEDKKIIDSFQKPIIPDNKRNSAVRANSSAEDHELDEISAEEREAHALKDQIIRDAEQFAEKHIQQAMEEANELKNQVQQEIHHWWDEQRKLDDQHKEEAKAQGYQEGYEQGLQEARNAIQEQYASMIEEAKSILELAHAKKQEIIAESETFLLELSCAIAEKIVHQQLTISEDWIIQLIKNALRRKREQGTITLCVSPDHFPKIQDARDELMLALDSQADLQILPDPSIQDHGCIIRSSLGSIDATVDTQLTEIKKALLQISTMDEDGPIDD